MTFFIYLFIGSAAGFMAGLLGIGGGIIVVPALTLLFTWLDFPQVYRMQMAIGTSLGAMVFTAASSAWSHYLKRGIDWSLFLLLAPGLVCGAVLGASIASALPSHMLKVFFALCLCATGVFFLVPQKIRKNESKIDRPRFLFILIGLGIGTISSILGMGGGLFTVPTLLLLRIPIKKAIATSAITGLLIALVGTVSFLSLGLDQDTGIDKSIGYLYLPAFICIGISASILAPFGAKMAHALPTEHLKRVFGVFVIIVGIAMLIQN
jgi:uncharacterized membrane protein YfcA